MLPPGGQPSPKRNGPSGSEVPSVDMEGHRKASEGWQARTHIPTCPVHPHKNITGLLLVGGGLV